MPELADIFPRVASVLVETLNVDEEDVKPTSTLQGDLGAEAIDFLDIVFRLEREFGITQSAVSQQLRILRDAGFASVRAEGTRRIYAVEPGRLREVDDWLDRFRVFWLPKLDALATEVARGKRKRRRQG